MTQRITDERLAGIERDIEAFDNAEVFAPNFSTKEVGHLIADLRDERAKVAECIEFLRRLRARYVRVYDIDALLAKLSGDVR